MNDTTLAQSFPSVGKPYVVWINKQGIVENFSSGTNVSKQNLRYFIDGKKMLFRDPTLERYGDAIEENKFEYISFISHCDETLNIGNNEIHEINNGKSVSIKKNCSSIVELFIKAFSEFRRFNFKTSYGLMLHVADTFKYQYPKNLELMDYWLSEHAYNYQLILPKKKSGQAYKIMQQDLIRYFDMKAFVKRIPIQGIMIIKDSPISQLDKKIVLKNYKKALEYARVNPDSVYIFKNEPMVKFSEWLKTKLSYYFPVVDSSNFHGNISVIIRKNSLRPFRFQQFKEDLNMSGLNCFHKGIEADVLFIEENSEIKGQ
jgi:hypothetical protein